YYKPRIDMEVLRKYSEGIIALSGCLSGNIPIAILQGNYEKAKSLALEYRDVFGVNNFYLELQMNNIEDQNLVNQNLIKLSRETGIPLVATNDIHYLRKEDARAHDILLCIQTGKKIHEEDRMKFNADDVYLKSPDEMYESFRNIPEALENTVKIAERCNVELEFNKLHLPEYNVPGNQDHFQYLKSLCMDGMIKRYGSNYSSDKQKRLDYELSVIKEMGYVDYFLIVWDFIKFAKDNGIMVGPGRGSGAGSIVAYCLGITNIDPLRFNLLFERFLNPERISMPDLDIYFCYERRQEVIDYVVKKYGTDRVAQIITFGTMAARAVIRDVGRAMDIPYGQVDAIAKMIPFRIGMTINKAIEINPELRDIYDNDEDIKELINTSKILEGMPRHSSTHAAGVVISKEPIVEYVPLQKNDENITTQFSMGNLEELGLLKMDFLGLRTLTVLRDAAETIWKIHGKIIDYDNMILDDANIYKMISEGKTTGLFQLESSGMTQFMKELKPSCIEDIIAGISLYRPGPMDQIPRYIKNKNNPDMVKYDHPLLEEILNVTYGCMVYQEQVMQIVRSLAGYSMGRADLVRRAMSKKKADIMKEERQNFIYGKTDEKGNVVIEGAIRRGVDEKTANKIFDEMMDFASYAFNKSHAAAYAVIAYQTAWLKYYYPTEFMAALLNSYLGNTDKISRYIAECKAMGIEILPPDINESDVKFSVVNGKIRFGMAAVKNAGEHAVIEIIRERKKNKEFNSFIDFCERINLRDVNKKCIESLIKCGAFDSMGIYRSKLLTVFEKVIDRIHETKRKNI
ncbi:MAG: DNA polymerase III subunit alpha, partial [Clostridiaceae bacterium]|nr:DNA polymerase III subunit alpha [Clostridiaceae bacterium]